MFETITKLILQIAYIFVILILLPTNHRHYFNHPKNINILFKKKSTKLYIDCLLFQSPNKSHLLFLLSFISTNHYTSASISMAAENSLDRLACGLGGKTMLPYVTSSIPALLQSRRTSFYFFVILINLCHKQRETTPVYSASLGNYS